MNQLITEALEIASSSPDARELVPTLNKLVALVRDNPGQYQAAADSFLMLFSMPPEYPTLGFPGVVQILEFCMHQLKLPLVREALTRLVSQATDWRVSRAAERVLAAFEDDWPDADIYELGPPVP